MKKVNLFSVFILITVLPLFYISACSGGRDMPEPVVCTLIYKNTTDHALSLEIYQYVGETIREYQTLKNTISLKIPAYSLSFQDIETAPNSLAPKDYEIQSCTISFDDGKVLKIEKGTDDDRIARDKNPIILGAYEPNLYLEGISVYCFSITEYHYSLAE